MFIKNKTKLIISLNILWVVLMMLLGSWWIYLIMSFGKHASTLGLGRDTDRIVNMLLWEGSTFFGLMFLLSGSLFFLYLRDLKKSHAMQVFFASLTHELKTPLASIKLQGEVIHESAEDSGNQKLIKLTERLIEDTGILESQMDKLLQLSRLERGGGLNLTSVNLTQKLKQIIKREKNKLDIHFSFNEDDEYLVLADEHALEIIFKNLLENTKIHAQNKNVFIQLENKLDHISLSYSDSGHFQGDIHRLGELFYKINSKKGSGIGLYLIYKLLSKMHGSITITSTQPFSLVITLKKDLEHA